MEPISDYIIKAVKDGLGEELLKLAPGAPFCLNLVLFAAKTDSFH
jgi:hypothetical protein